MLNHLKEEEEKLLEGLREQAGQARARQEEKRARLDTYQGILRQRRARIEQLEENVAHLQTQLEGMKEQRDNIRRHLEGEEKRLGCVKTCFRLAVVELAKCKSVYETALRKGESEERLDEYFQKAKKTFLVTTRIVEASRLNGVVAMEELERQNKEAGPLRPNQAQVEISKHNPSHNQLLQCASTALNAGADALHTLSFEEWDLGEIIESCKRICEEDDELIRMKTNSIWRRKRLARQIERVLHNSVDLTAMLTRGLELAVQEREIIEEELATEKARIRAA